jgi:lipoprotein NlpI
MKRYWPMIVGCFSFLGTALAVTPAMSESPLWAEAQSAAQKHDYAAAVQKVTELLESSSLDSDEEEKASLRSRGGWNFRLGRLVESLADFDRLIAKYPDMAPQLWERGITCYYLKEFANGAQQFEQYQTYYSNDVENAVWRYLCQAKVDGREQARKDMLPIKADGRIPMMEVYDLFQGNAQPKQVLDRIRTVLEVPDEAREARFMAHLYLGLYFDSEGDAKSARTHIDQAVEQYEKGHYMWAVARQHQRHLSERAEREE